MKRNRHLRRGIYLLPTLLTIGNLFCGFASIILATQGALAQAPAAPVGQSNQRHQAILVTRELGRHGDPRARADRVVTYPRPDRASEPLLARALLRAGAPLVR